VVLQDFTAEFEMGKSTALVGPSGSGKSTIVQMVERFYDPTEGEVLVDGVNIKDLNLNSFRRQVGYVGQEPVLFNDTIKGNLRYVKPDATDEEMIDALKKANAWDFISKNPLQLDANVGSGGSQLSGG
jgi:ABC-type multidrug transport system fused ATPase/permease subunit